MRNIIQLLKNATINSIAGLRAAILNEFAFRLEVFITAFVVPLAFVVGHTAAEKAMLIASWMLVLIIELINSAIEATVDRISLDIHELSGKAKDMGSAAVFLASINVVIVWLLIIF